MRPLVVAAALAALPAGAQWSLGVMVPVGPLENFPRVGVAVDARAEVSELVALGVSVGTAVPLQVGVVVRSITAIRGHVVLTPVRTPLLRWYVDVGPGVGLFIDDYLASAPATDQVSGALGLHVATGLRFVVGRFEPFLEVRGSLFFAPRAVDDDWLEVAVGLRVALGAR